MHCKQHEVCILFRRLLGVVFVVESFVEDESEGVFFEDEQEHESRHHLKRVIEDCLLAFFCCDERLKKRLFCLQSKVEILTIDRVTDKTFSLK